MSIFGELDTSVIPDDPFYTPPNTYHCVCTSAKFFTKDEDTVPNLVITWTVDEPTSDYHGNNIQEWFKLPLHPDAQPKRTWADLEANEKKSQAFLKKRLRRGFDLSESEVDTFSDPEDLVSREAKVTTKTNKGFTNVVDAVNTRLWEEERQQTDETNESLGLGATSGL